MHRGHIEKSERTTKPSRDAAILSLPETEKLSEALKKLEKGVSGKKLILYPWEDADKTEL